MVQSPNEIPVVNPSSSSASNSDDVDMPNGDESTVSSSSEIVVPSTPPSKQEQLNLLKTAMMQRFQVGSTVYLFPTKWFDGFTDWARGTAGQQPSRVDPFPVLCDQDGVLLDSAQEYRDYHIVSQEGWSLIQRWSSPILSASEIDADVG